MSAKVYNRGLYLGDTIQEKTRSLLGWNDHCLPSSMSSNEASTSRRSPGGSLPHVGSVRRHPYAVPVTTSCRARKNSCSSSSSSCSSSDYSQPSPSYSVRSYPESLSPEPIVGNSAASGPTNSVFPLEFSTQHYSVQPNPAFRSAEREARVFERLRQLVPVLPSDRNAYQVLIDTVSQVMDLEHQLEQLNEQAEDVKNSLRIEESTADVDSWLFPDDLRSVDVTAFKHLLCSDSLGQVDF